MRSQLVRVYEYRTLDRGSDHGHQHVSVFLSGFNYCSSMFLSEYVISYLSTVQTGEM